MKKLADGTEIAEDGESVRVSMLMMDSMQRAVAQGKPKGTIHDGLGNPAGHKPRYVFAPPSPSDEVRSETYRDYEHRLTDAWRGTVEGGSAAHDRSAPYEAYKERLSNAWRGAR